MALINRIRVGWSGSPVVGAGLTTFYADPAVFPISPTAVKAFFTAVKGLFPTGITWDIPNTGDSIEETDGQIMSSWSGSGGGTEVSSGGTTSFASGVGARVAWATGTIHAGRRVRGSTFLAPLLSVQFENNGSIQTTALTTMNNAASALITAHGGSLCVWSRPLGPRVGIHSPIVTGTVPDKTSWLRSRRV